MNRNDQDVRPLAVVVVVVIAVLVIGSAGVSAGLLRRAAALAPVVGVPVLAAAVIAAVCRVVATRRSLASRTRLLVLAPDSFDPSIDAVLRCAAQLSRVRRLVGGWLDPRARAVRVLLDCDAEGKMRYTLSAPERALPALRSALTAFDRVQVIELDSEPPAEAKPQMATVRAELRLARPSSEPLAHLPLNPDPLQGFAKALAGLDPAHREQAEVAIDLLPTTPATRRRLRRRLLKEAARRGGVEQASPVGKGALMIDFGGAPAGRRRPAEMVEQRAEREEIAAKLVQAEPIFRLQVLIRCRSPERGRAVSCLQGLLSCFDGFAGANSLRVVGVRFFGLAFLGSDLPGRRGWFDRRMRTELFRPARRDYVTAREIAGLLKPPTVDCAAPEVVRLGPAVYPAPRALPTFTGQANLLPLGVIEDESGPRRIGLRLEDSFFTYTAGRSRWGKTELALTQCLHLFRAGHGGLFLDPHQDAVQRIKSCLTDEGLAERVIELDLVSPRSREGQPGWNLFAARGLDPDAAERRVEAIVDSFASALQWGERNNRALTLTTQATAALIELAAVLPDGLQPTIFQIPSILGNSDWLAAALPFLSPPRRQFFMERFPRLSEEAITPVTNLIDRLRSSTQLAALLGAQTSSYDIARAMNERRIVLACPGAGGAKDKLVANLLVYDLLHGAKGRAALPPAQRQPFYVFLDEVQLKAHTIAVNQVGVAFVLAARAREDECGPDSWRNEVAHPITLARGRGAAELVIADALLSYLQTDEDGGLALHQRFVELDRGTLTAEQLANKIARYTRLRHFKGSADAGAEPEWRKRYRAWPHLLVVLADQPRERMRQRLARTLALYGSDPATSGEVPLSFVALDDLSQQGPFAPVFFSAPHPDTPVDWLGNRTRDVR